MKNIYVIRHCEAEGQPAEAKLTDEGLKQALELAELFLETKIDRIISSPYKRAIQSIQPLANRLNIEVEVNSLLSERVLSTNSYSDWYEKLRNTFGDFELKFEGGESSQDAVNRIVQVFESVYNSEVENTIIVTHGNLMALLLNYFNENFGFNDWESLSNPDVYHLKIKNENVTYTRLWKQN